MQPVAFPHSLRHIYDRRALGTLRVVRRNVLSLDMMDLQDSELPWTSPPMIVHPNSVFPSLTLTVLIQATNLGIAEPLFTVSISTVDF